MQNSQSETELIDLEIQKLLQKEVIAPSIPEKSEFVSPIFTVPKPEGGIRLILNLTLILPGLLNTRWTLGGGGGRILRPPNSLVSYPRNIKLGMWSMPVIIF